MKIVESGSHTQTQFLNIICHTNTQWRALVWIQFGWILSQTRWILRPSLAWNSWGLTPSLCPSSGGQCPRGEQGNLGLSRVQAFCHSLCTAGWQSRSPFGARSSHLQIPVLYKIDPLVSWSSHLSSPDQPHSRYEVKNKIRIIITIMKMRKKLKLEVRWSGCVIAMLDFTPGPADAKAYICLF